MQKITTILVLSILLFLGCSSLKDLNKTPIGLINNVSYKNAKFNNSNASNGFLVQYKNQTYAITAKHILLIAKTDKMKFVDFEGELKQWKMHPKNDTTNYVLLDKLLTTNKKDSLTWSYLNSNWDHYNDWLVFSVKENNSNNKPLEFRETPLKEGDNLYVFGWSYKDSLGSQRMYEYKFVEVDGNYYNLKQIKGPKNLGGLSGSPVVDEKGRAVGLVSSGWEDEKTKETFITATNLKNAKSFISKLEK